MPSVPRPGPVPVIMLVCAAVGSVVPPGPSDDVDLRPDPSAPSPAAGLDEVTGHQHLIIAPAGDAIMMPAGDGRPGGDVIAGTWRQGPDGPVPVANGDWLAWENGVPRSLGTPRLSEAARALGISLLPGGPPPSQPVGFYSGLTGAQTAALSVNGYRVTEEGLARAGSRFSFYEALIAALGNSLPGIEGEATPEAVHAVLVAAFEADITSARPRYREFIGGDQTPAEVLADLRDPGRWGRQIAELLPHLAAGVFGRELGVLAEEGDIGPVTDLPGPGLIGPGDMPFLLVRLPGGHFAPAETVLPVYGPRRDPARYTPLAARVPAVANPWTAEPTPEAERLARQEARIAPLPPGAAEPDAVGRVAEMNYLASFARDRARIAPVMTSMPDLVGRSLAPGVPKDQREEILRQIDMLETVSELLKSEPTLDRGDRLTTEYLQAVGQAQGEAARASRTWTAQDAAYVRTVAEFAGDIRALRDARSPNPPGHIRATLEAAERAGRGAEAGFRDSAHQASIAAAAEQGDLPRRVTDLVFAQLALDLAESAGRLLDDALVQATYAKGGAEEDLPPHPEAAAGQAAF